MKQVIINKIANIERCLQRIEEEYLGHEKEIDINYTKQDAVILNLQRACQAAIDLATYLVTTEKLGVPQTSRDVFDLLLRQHIIDEQLSKNMQNMVGFRNLAVHQVDMSIIHSILENHLKDFQSLIDITKKYL